jgi:hypothetical protein
MGSQIPRPLKEKSSRLKRFVVARRLHYLYDSRKASERDSRENVVQATRAIILVALLGGAIWFLLFKVTVQVLGTR